MRVYIFNYVLRFVRFSYIFCEYFGQTIDELFQASNDDDVDDDVNVNGAREDNDDMKRNFISLMYSSQAWNHRKHRLGDRPTDGQTDNRSARTIKFK